MPYQDGFIAVPIVSYIDSAGYYPKEKVQEMANEDYHKVIFHGKLRLV